MGVAREKEGEMVEKNRSTLFGCRSVLYMLLDVGWNESGVLMD